MFRSTWLSLTHRSADLLHYSELSDFFYVWLRLVLKDNSLIISGRNFRRKTLEAVANRARQPR